MRNTCRRYGSRFSDCDVPSNFPVMEVREKKSNVFARCPFAGEFFGPRTMGKECKNRAGFYTLKSFERGYPWAFGFELYANVTASHHVLPLFSRSECFFYSSLFHAPTSPESSDSWILFARPKSSEDRFNACRIARCL